jgi:serine/threonine protein kinase
LDPAEISVFLSETLAGRYRPTKHIDSGAFSGVFLAEDLHNSGREVALKILRLQLSGQPGPVQEFCDEIALLEKLAGCDRVIGLEDSGQHTVNLDHPVTGVTISFVTRFAALELAAGSLSDLLLHGAAFGWPDRLRLYRDVVKGVHQMHLRRIVHRDVKADNALVFARPAGAKVADLGRAHDTAEPPRFAVEAYLSGRGDPHFAPLEFLWLQGTQAPKDQALADLFLLGALLFEVATGISFTATVVGNPRTLMSTHAALPDHQREADWIAHQPWLRDAARPVYETLALELPSSIRDRTLELVEQLTDPEPARRLPSSRGGRARADAWDLQWLLARIDSFRRMLDPTFRRAYLRARPRQMRSSRPRSRKP